MYTHILPGPRARPDGQEAHEGEAGPMNNCNKLQIIYIYIYIYIYTYTYTCIYIYIYIHVYVHI